MVKAATRIKPMKRLRGFDLLKFPISPCVFPTLNHPPNGHPKYFFVGESNN